MAAIRTLPLALALASALGVGCRTAAPTAGSREATQVASPLHGDGIFAIRLTPTAKSSADGNTVVEFDFHEVLTGMLDGTRDGSGRLTLHADGTFEGGDCGTYTGSVGGVGSGTTRFCVEGQGAGHSIHGTYRFREGTGGLAGLDGEGSFTGQETGPFTFNGTYSGRAVMP